MPPLQGRDANGLRRRTVARIATRRRRTTWGCRRPRRTPVRRTGRPTARPRTRGVRHRPRRCLRHQRRKTLQVGARSTIEATHSQDAQSGRSARVFSVARKRDRTRSTARHPLPRRNRGEGAPRRLVQCDEEARRRGGVRMGRSSRSDRPSCGSAPRPARRARPRRTNVRGGRAKGGEGARAGRKKGAE